MPNINDYGLPFTSQDGDRKYSALEWREYFSRLIHNGLIQNAANECQVKPRAVPNKTVYVDTGVVFINGAMRVLEEPVTLTIAENTSGNPRIDRVVARLNEASRTIEFDVLEGTPAGSPAAPALTRTEGVYELGLADLTLANGYSTITSGAISDKRWDVSLCGASSMTIGVIPPSGLDAVTVQLSPANQIKYATTNVDAALSKATPVASYLAWIGNVNSTSLDHAFGKSNDDLVSGIGLQLAMYAWAKGTSKVTQPFTNLISCNTFDDCLVNAAACQELLTDANILSLISSSPYAIGYMGTKDLTPACASIAGLNPSDYPTIASLIAVPSALDTVVKNTTARKVLFDVSAIYKPLLASASALNVLYNNASVVEPEFDSYVQASFASSPLYSVQNPGGATLKVSGKCIFVNCTSTTGSGGSSSTSLSGFVATPTSITVSGSYNNFSTTGRFGNNITSSRGDACDVRAIRFV